MHHTKRQQDIDDIIGMIHRIRARRDAWQAAGEYSIKRRLFIAVLRAMLTVFHAWISMAIPTPDTARLLQAMRDF